MGLVDRFIGVIVLAFVITGIAIVVSKRAQTGNVLTSLFKGLQGLQKGATSALK